MEHQNSRFWLYAASGLSIPAQRAEIADISTD
jgi:hypothetical protein